MPSPSIADHIVFIVHYFPPINSSGAKRVEAISKYLARTGRKITVITTRKSSADGQFTEAFPPGVEVFELDWLGRSGESIPDSSAYEPMYTGKPSFKRRIKDLVMRWFGQLPDPRLPFALSFLSPALDKSVCTSLRSASVVVGSCPPWPMLLAALIVRWRFGIPCVLDYRDHFSECHEMPGSHFAKLLERIVDRKLAMSADALVTISSPMANYYSGFRNDVSVIMNGYDHEAMEEARSNLPEFNSSRHEVIVIRYLGIVSPGRIPKNLLAALSKLIKQRVLTSSKLRFEYYGNGAVLELLLQQKYPELIPLFIFREAVPYQSSLMLMATSDYLLFSETSEKSSLSAQGILTTKLFEYLGSGRPIIADISSDTLAGNLITEADKNHFVSNNADEFEHYLLRPDFWNPCNSINSPFVKTLSRAYQAGQYQTLLDSVGLSRSNSSTSKTY